MDLPDWVPEGVEVTTPNAARMYDYTLGGYHNFAVDREYIERAEQAMSRHLKMVSESYWKAVAAKTRA